MNDPNRLSDYADTSEIDPLLRGYFRAQVTVYTGEAGYNDTGRLTYMDSTWVELTKRNGERILISVASIRIIKLIEPAKIEGDAGTLLRPANETPRLTK